MNSYHPHSTGDGTYMFSPFRIASICGLINAGRLYIVALSEYASLPSFT